MNRDSEYWFPAKTHGWGWGPPRTWQGWALLTAYVALLMGGVPILDPEANPWLFVVYTIFLSAVLTFICFKKGEPPRWRWGKGDA